MAKDVSNVQGIDNTTPGYVNGKVKDNETLVGEELYNDIVQFFQKLLALSGLAPNGNYDNEINGYQYIDALISKIRATAASTTEKGTVEKATTTEAQTGVADKFLDAELLQQVTATLVRAGIQANANQSEALALTIGTKTITPLSLSYVLAGYRLIEYELGAWDMSADDSLIIAHGLDDHKKIKILSCEIYSDDGIYTRPLTFVSINPSDPIGGGIQQITSTSIYITRTTGGIFDTNNFDDTGINRGKLLIAYEQI